MADKKAFRKWWVNQRDSGELWKKGTGKNPKNYAEYIWLSAIKSMGAVEQSGEKPEQHTQSVISVQVVKKLICDWVGEDAMEEIGKLIDQHLRSKE